MDMKSVSYDPYVVMGNVVETNENQVSCLTLTKGKQQSERNRVILSIFMLTQVHFYSFADEL